MKRHFINFINLFLDSLPHQTKVRLAQSTRAKYYRKLIRFVGKSEGIERQLIESGPLKGKYIFIGPASERGYFSFREYTKGIYEPVVVESIMRNCPKDSLVLDIGAHFGYFSILMSTIIGPHGLCISFEANRDNYNKLVNTIKINDITNIRPEYCALSEKTGKSVFITHENSLMGHLSSEPSEFSNVEQLEWVNVWRLDDYVQNHQVENISFMKIDVEGAEKQVLEGGLITLKKYKPTLLIEVHTFEDVRKNIKPLLIMLTQLGYRILSLQNEEVLDLKHFNGGHILAKV